jgi:uncharacterized protein (DUF58 family)
VNLTGRAAALALLGVIPVALAPGWTSLLGWAAVLLVVTLVVRREPVASVRLGQPAESALLIGNPGGRRVRGLLRDAWQPSAGVLVTRQPLDLPAGQRRRLVTRLQPTRRGDRTAAHVTVRSLGPFGVAGRQATLVAPGQVRVLPPFASRKHLPDKLSRLRELDGRTSLQVRGAGTEFDSLRDYVDGDDVRSIDWRATARRQQVVVRTWRPERDRRVLLVLDTSRTSASRVGDAPRLDAAMDAALLLAALASRAGDRVDLIAVDRRVRAQVVGASRTDLLPALVNAMAPLDATLVEADWTTIATEIRNRMTRRALVVLLTPLDAAAIEEGLLPVIPGLVARHQLLIASVRDPHLEVMAADRGDSYAVYGAAAAERSFLERDAIIAELGRAGVQVVDASPDQLPPRLADRYLALKAAGRL